MVEVAHYFPLAKQEIREKIKKVLYNCFDSAYSIYYSIIAYERKISWLTLSNTLELLYSFSRAQNLVTMLGN